MNRSDKEKLCYEIDDFLTCDKWLVGSHPIWRENGRADQLDAKWVIEETGNVSNAHLAFRYNRVSTEQPSVSLIYKRKKVCRVDVKPQDESDGNPMQAAKFDLPPRVFGTHVHLWKYNREYVLDCLPPNEWEIPIKSEISQSAQQLGHILALICSECNIQFTPEQRDLNPPSREDLFS